MDRQRNGWYEMKSEHDAPEVANIENYPVAVTPDEEGLQAVRGQKGGDVREYRQDGVAIAADGGDRTTSRRSRWLWIALAAVLCLVGMGAGIVIGVAIGRSTER